MRFICLKRLLKTKTEEDITDIINKMWEEYELTPNNVENYHKPENIVLTQRKVNNYF